METQNNQSRFPMVVMVPVLFAALWSPCVNSRAGDWLPLLPSQDFYDFQLFAPPDLQEYEIYPEPKEGIFFDYERLWWGITRPQFTSVGSTDAGYLIPTQPISPQTIAQLNNANLEASQSSGVNVIGGIYIFGTDVLQLDLNTTWMQTKMSWGNRYEGGWIYDGRGIEISYFDSGEQSQDFMTLNEFAASSPTQVFTQEAESGGAEFEAVVPSVTTTITAVSPPPDHVISQKLTQQNFTQIQGGSVAALVQRSFRHRGSRTTVRVGFGPRFVQVSDRFKLGYESNQYPFNVTDAGGGGAAGGGGGGGGAAGGGGG
ncbi:MAG: hypothetical protein ACKOCN_06830, partial [Planctomycetaceae bacterium]